MANDPGPTVIDIQYSTRYGFHMMRLHTRAWTPPSSGHDLGEVPRWSDDTPIDVKTMVTDLVTEFLPFFPDTTSFNFATVATNAVPNTPLVPQATQTLTGLVGTSLDLTWSKAVQQTMVARTIGHGVAKIVLLDCESFSSFDAVRDFSTAPDLVSIMLEFFDITNAWSGNDNTRPNVAIGSFKTLNEKLRKAYRMT